MNKIRTGQIIRVDLGIPPRQIVGHEQAKERFCLVLKSLPLLKLIVIIPFTSKKPRGKHFYYVPVLKDEQSLTIDSYALCHQIRTVSIDRVTGAKKMLGASYLNQIKIVMMDLLELE